MKRTSVLSRELEWIDGKGLTLCADPRHVKVMVEKLKCGHNNSLKVPMEKVKVEDEKDKAKDILARNH